MTGNGSQLLITQYINDYCIIQWNAFHSVNISWIQSDWIARQWFRMTMYCGFTQLDINNSKSKQMLGAVSWLICWCYCFQLFDDIFVIVNRFRNRKPWLRVYAAGAISDLKHNAHFQNWMCAFESSACGDILQLKDIPIHAKCSEWTNIQYNCYFPTIYLWVI